MNEKDFKKKGLKIDVYQKKTPGFKVDMVRMDCIMKDCDIVKFCDYYRNPPDSEYMKECTVHETKPNGDMITYLRMGLPLMTDRDCVVYIHEEKVNETDLYINAQSIVYPPRPPIKDAIRMYQAVTGYIRPHPTDPSLTLYTEINVMDMKGSIPAWLLNSTMAGQVVGEMYKLMDFCRKK